MWANLRRSDLSNANLEDAVFFNANLQLANLTGVKLSGANFIMADLSNAKLNLKSFFSLPFNQMGELENSNIQTPARGPKYRRDVILINQNFQNMDFPPRRGGGPWFLVFGGGGPCEGGPLWPGGPVTSLVRGATPLAFLRREI